LRDLGDLVLERLQGAGYIGLEHDVEFLEPALAGALEDLLEGDLARLAASQLLGLEAGLALLGDGAGLPLVLDDLDVLAGVRDSLEAKYLDPHAPGCPIDSLALVIEHRPDPAPDRSRNDGVAALPGRRPGEDT